MDVVIIRTVGEVALNTTMDQAVGYRYDVPFDSLEMPYLPLGRMLAEAGCVIETASLGFAHPDGYYGLIDSANKLLRNMPGCAGYIRSFFTNDRFVEEKGYRVRSLKAGQTFVANISFDPAERERVRQALSSITHIGVTDGDITGEVVVELDERKERQDANTELPNLCEYKSLDFSVMLVTPACFYMPYADGVKTSTFIPGEVIREELLHRAGGTAVDLTGIVCTNAYISNGNARMLPMPLCAAVVKLDREQFRYRLAPGKNPEIAEQDVGLSGAYTDDAQHHYVQYTYPDTEHILSDDGQVYDALSSGQIFSGTIYGTDEQLRFIALWMAHFPVTHIGKLSGEGFGEVYRRVVRLGEAEIPVEYFAESFDVYCVSNLLLIGEDGMPTTKAEDLLLEIERVLGINGRLRLIGKYTNVSRESTWHPKWGSERANTRMFAAGSVLRIAAEGGPVDISGILHCFIGERTYAGCGEVVTYPARGGYYRLAENLPPLKYAMRYMESSREQRLGAAMTGDVIAAMLKSKVQGLAIADRPEYENHLSVRELMPMDILLRFRDRWDPTVTEETLANWYEKALMEDGNDGLFD